MKKPKHEKRRTRPVKGVPQPRLQQARAAEARARDMQPTQGGTYLTRDVKRTK